jgi:hypothetical protein
VTKADGIFLLIVEVNHPPTPTEPLTLHPQELLLSFQPGFNVNRSWRCAIGAQHDIYGSVLENRKPQGDHDAAILCAFLTRKTPAFPK